MVAGVALAAVIFLLAAGIVLAAGGGGDDEPLSRVAAGSSTTEPSTSTSLAPDDTTTTIPNLTGTPSPSTTARPRQTAQATTPVGSSGPPIVFERVLRAVQSVEIWMMDADGANQRRLGAFSVRPPGGTCGTLNAHGLNSWSPDGQRYLVLSRASDCGTGQSSAEIYDRSGRQVGRVQLGTSEVTVAWSPNGAQLVAAYRGSGGPSTGLTVYDIATGTASKQIPGFDTSLVDWAPSSRLAVIAHTADDKDGRSLYTLDPDGTNIRRVTHATGIGVPRWSGDGRVLYPNNPTDYSPPPPESSSEVIRDAVGATPSRVCGYTNDYAWSLDSRFVACAAKIGNGEPTLTVAPSDGGAPVATVPGGVNPAFDNSGHVLFVKDGVIWLMNADGSGQRRLTDGQTPKPAPH